MRRMGPPWGDDEDEEEEDIMVGAEVNPKKIWKPIGEYRGWQLLTRIKFDKVFNYQGYRLFPYIVLFKGRSLQEVLDKIDNFMRKRGYNPLTKVHPLAIEARNRYREDKKAGHTGAAEYWRGQAGAFFTGNPANPTLVIPIKSKKQLGHLFKAQSQLSKAGVTFDSGTGIRNRAPRTRHWELDWSLKGARISNPVHYLQTLARQYGGRYSRQLLPNGQILHTVTFRKGTLNKLRRNPIWPMIGEYFVAGLGLGAGFKAIEWGVKQIKEAKK